MLPDCLDAFGKVSGSDFCTDVVEIYNTDMIIPRNTIPPTTIATLPTDFCVICLGAPHFSLDEFRAEFVAIEPDRQD